MEFWTGSFLDDKLELEVSESAQSANSGFLLSPIVTALLAGGSKVCISFFEEVKGLYLTIELSRLGILEGAWTLFLLDVPLTVIWRSWSHMVPVVSSLGSWWSSQS